MCGVPDPVFADPRLADIYDVVDGDRRDLDAYATIVDELGASSILDVGCGTGTLACRLATDGCDVVGLDPAGASLDVARRKAGSERVRWVNGDVSDLPPLDIELAVMTGNVAQVFVTDEDWCQTLTAARFALRPGGWLVFETRNPARRAWERWIRGLTYRELHVPVVGRVDTWTEVLDVRLPLVSFRQSFRFDRDGVELVSESTLRFRDREEITECLGRTGFAVREVRDAPDRPGLEFVFMAQRAW